MGLKKYVISGDIIEVYNYSQYCSGTGGAHRTSEKSCNEEQVLRNYANTNQRRRDRVRRLACSNFNNYDKFFTLTFKDNITDIKYANEIFKKFIMRLKYKLCIDIKYLAVIEFQERGAVHYHVLSDIPYIPQQELQQIWGQGFVFINAIQHVDNIGAYIVKYMTKDSLDSRLQGQKAYLYSRNLQKPYELVNHNLKEFDKLENKIIEKYDLNNLDVVYESHFDSEVMGSCEYQQYNLNRLKK